MTTWTAPITFTSTTLTAAQMNTEVRDHLNFLKGALDLITSSTTADTGSATNLVIYRAASTDPTFQSGVAGDASSRQAVFASGETQWGGGAGAKDVRLYRNGISSLIADANGAAATMVLTVQASAAQHALLDMSIVGDAGPRTRLWGSQANGGMIEFGSGGGAADVTLYRYAANTLKTDDHLVCVDGIQTRVKAGVPADGDFTATVASGTIAVDSTNSRIYIRVGTTWKYAALT